MAEEMEDVTISVAVNIEEGCNTMKVSCCLQFSLATGLRSLPCKDHVVAVSMHQFPHVTPSHTQASNTGKNMLSCINLQKPCGSGWVMTQTGIVNIAVSSHESAYRWWYPDGCLAEMRKGCNLAAVSATEQSCSGSPLLTPCGERAWKGTFILGCLIYS